MPVFCTNWWLVLLEPLAVTTSPISIVGNSIGLGTRAPAPTENLHEACVDVGYHVVYAH